VEINVDLGEGKANDKYFMQYINSCSIACGGHVGSIKSIKKTIKNALEYGVNVGSHPSYPDKKNFGRTSISMKLNEFQDSIYFQLMNFKKSLAYFKTNWHHCKAHGALYNDLVDNHKLIEAYLEILKEFPEINYLIFPTSKQIIKIAEKKGFNVIKEIFSDRRYDKSLSLIPRSNENSIIKSLSDFSSNLEFLLKGKIKTSNDTFKNVSFDTICLHSDSFMSEKFIIKIHESVNKKLL